MNPQTVTLGELEQLLAGLEEGGASGLSIADLAFMGRMLELIREKAAAVAQKVGSEAHDRLNAREADVLAENGSAITRSWKNQYDTDLPALAAHVIKLDADFASETFEFVPAKTTVVEAHWELKGNITKVNNWVEKLGLSGERQTLEKLIGKKKVSPMVGYKAVNPETGELL